MCKRLTELVARRKEEKAGKMDEWISKKDAWMEGSGREKGSKENF